MRVSFALFALVAAVIMSLSSAFMHPTPRMARQVRQRKEKGDDDVCCGCLSLPLPLIASRPLTPILCMSTQ